MIDWGRVRAGCPRCGDRLQYHSKTAWCLGCGWGRNWEPPASTMVRFVDAILRAAPRR